MRYNAGWLIQGKILALTHFEPVVTPEDFMGISARTQMALKETTQPFHLLIDNRIITNTTVVSLETILGSFPTNYHTMMRQIVLILPEAIKDQVHELSVQQNGEIQLSYVDGLETAYNLLRSVDPSIDWKEIDPLFFNDA